jgi:hypothetical protein
MTSWFLSRAYTVTLFLLLAMAVVLTEIERKKTKTPAPLRVGWPVLTLGLQVASIAAVYVTARLRAF